MHATPTHMAAAAHGAEGALRLRAVRHQAKLELRAAQRQLHDRGLSYAASWAADLLCEIDVDAPGSTSTSSLTSAMASKLASAQNSNVKPSLTQQHQRGTPVALHAVVPPPAFEEHSLVGGLQHAPSRRHTITTNLFASPGPHSSSSAAESTPARPAQSSAAGLAPLSPFNSVSPIIGSPLPHSHSHGAAGMHGSSTAARRDSGRMHDGPTPPRGVGPSHPPTPLAAVPSMASLEAAASLGPLHLSPALSSTSDSAADSPWSDALLRARSYYDLKEFRRAAYVLRDAPLHPRTLFLRCYCLYLAGERRKEEEQLERKKGGAGSGGGGGGGDGNAKLDGNDGNDAATVINRELRGLQQQLARVLVRDAHTLTADGTPRPDHPLAPFIADGHLWFLYGLVLRELGLRSAARQALLVSVTAFPWNWGAWQTLQGFVQTREQLEQVMAFMHARAADQLAAGEIAHAALMAEAAANGTPPPHPLPPHAPGVFMKDLFFCDALVALQSNAESESLDVLDKLCVVFPDAMHVRVSTALAFYARRQFPEAQHLLELCALLDPHRLEHMDTLSNILFVHGERTKLSMLAHEAMCTDKYRVQTCCIVGNYYSLRGEHARAVLYFQRALSLDPSYLSAWTLLGHEFVELRATAQAIGAYRRALDINPLDYRAWYGLGQTYEILQCSKYALYYFQRAAAVKPYDARMWCAMGENYEKLALECDAATVAAPAAAGPAALHAASAGASSAQSARLLENALKCYQKAEGLNDADGVALHKLAKLYRRRGQNALAAEYYRKVLRRHEAEVGLGAAAVEEEQMQTLSTDDDARMDGGAAAASSSAAAAAVAAAAVPSVPPPLHPDAVDAMLFLTEYSLKVLGDLDVAEAFCARLLDAGGAGGATSAAGAPRDLAKALMAEIRQIKGHNTMKRALQQQQQRTLSATSTAAHTPAHQPQLLQQQQQSHASLRPSPSTPARPPGAAPAAAPVSASPGSFFSTPARSP